MWLNKDAFNLARSLFVICTLLFAVALSKLEAKTSIVEVKVDNSIAYLDSLRASKYKFSKVKNEVLSLLRKHNFKEDSDCTDTVILTEKERNRASAFALLLINVTFCQPQEYFYQPD